MANTTIIWSFWKVPWSESTLWKERRDLIGHFSWIVRMIVLWKFSTPPISLERQRNLSDCLISTIEIYMKLSDTWSLCRRACNIEFEVCKIAMKMLSVVPLNFESYKGEKYQFHARLILQKNKAFYFPITYVTTRAWEGSRGIAVHSLGTHSWIEF